MKLYELTSNYNKVWEMLNEDIDIQTIEDTLQSIEAGIELKAQNTVSLVKNLEVYSNGLDSEIARLLAKKKSVDNKITSIQSFLFGQLEYAGLTEMKTPVATIKQVNNPPSVTIENSEIVPAKYQTIIPASYKISKSEIAKDIKSGVDVPGCFLEHSKRWAIK